MMAARLLALALLAAALLAAHACHAQGPRIVIDAGSPGAKINPTLYGIFFEEINRAGDGGLYAEMLQNRGFEDARDPDGWGVSGPGDVGISIDTAHPLNDRTPRALRLQIKDETGGTAFCRGFGQAGLHLRKGAAYRLVFFARGEGKLPEPLLVWLAGEDGNAIASRRVGRLTDTWTKYEVTLRPSATTTRGTLHLSVRGPGTAWFDVVSLMPADTWKGHGLRKDLAETIAAMKPGFVRFPGGCFVEGDTLADAERWKDGIGPIEQRKGHRCIWGYRSTGGFGLHEFLQWCEDLGAEPLYVINCGMSHREVAPMSEMHVWVQDAVDLIEYARGPVTSKWGAKRAAAGHPAPFRLNYLQIGNENGGPDYDARYALFHDAVKARYPDIKLVANVWGSVPTSRKLDIVDEHYYNEPRFFMRRAGQYDGYDRSGPKVYVGEYAVTTGNPGQGNLNAALGEAAFMTGIERNGDHVVMASYAPLMVNPLFRRWNPNAIVFDQARVYGTPSYHVQGLFSRNRADRNLPVEVEGPIMERGPEGGGIGVGTWSTSAEFTDVVVTARDGTVLFNGREQGGWRVAGGQWSIANGLLRQTGGDEPARALVGDPSWKDYTLRLKARKLGGAEGFLVMFETNRDTGKRWWNIGGWGNARHAIEADGLDDSSVRGSIEENRWYDIEVDVMPDRVRCRLDGRLIHDVPRTGVRMLYAVAGLTEGDREAVVKVVNVGSTPVATAIELKGVRRARAGEAWVLTSDSLMDENSFDAPTRVAPVPFTLKADGSTFSHTFPPRSVTVMRLAVQR